ncbi:MAG: ABC transporter ATP-binding protein [Candidatus Aminicenantales bacterium]
MALFREPDCEFDRILHAIEMDAITVENLKKHYPVIRGYRELLLHPLRKKRVAALDGVNLEVKEGRCFCLLGPNGAGKTTLIKILATLVLPDEGRASVNGFDVERQAEKARSSIGYAISEERSFYWRLTGRQNLEFFGRLNNIASSELNRKIEEVLELTNLSEAADLRFNTYSTGMRMMMAFARALLTDARVLFVDEPTKSLDPQAAQKIRTFLRKEMVERQGRTVFWATHNLAEAEEFAQELAIIDKGKIKVKGTVAGLTGNGRLSLQEVYNRAVESTK